MDNIHGKYDRLLNIKSVFNDTLCLNIGYAVGKTTSFLEKKERVIGGITISSENQILSASGRGIIIESDGVIIGEIFENLINIHIRDCSDKKLFEYVIDKIVEFLKLPDEEKMKIISVGLEHNTKILTDNFADNLLQIRDKIIHESKKDMNELKENVVKYQKQLTNSIRELDMIVNIEKGLTKEEFSKKAIREYLSLQRNKNVKDVYFVDNILTVFTEKIFCVHKKIIYYIGEFKIILRPDKSGGSVVSFHNLTQKVDALYEKQNAPHVFAEGNACLGNISTALPQLVGRGEYATAIALSIEFLQTVNVDDAAGKFITRWPVIDSETYETHMKKRGLKNSLPSINAFL